VIASLVNGRPGDRIAILDRGLQYGDGLFETIAVVDGRPALWKRHLDRLALGCRQLGIPMPDADLLRTEAERLIGDRTTAILKLVVTRGVGGRGYGPPADAEPTRILQLFDWHGPEGRPLALRICRQRLGIQPGLGGLKHLNRLEQVLARRECPQGEGLLLDTEGFVVEGIASNLFLLVQGRLHTPLIDRCGVAGVVRELVLEKARQAHQPVVVRRILPQELEEAEGLFLTSSLLGVVPVDELDGEARAVNIRHHPLLEEVADLAFKEHG